MKKGYFHSEINGQKKTNQLLSLLTVMMLNVVVTKFDFKAMTICTMPLFTNYDEYPSGFSLLVQITALSFKSCWDYQFKYDKKKKRKKTKMIPDRIIKMTLSCKWP